jgi:hypothetical protein
LSICLFIFLFFYPYIFLFIYLFIHLFIFLLYVHSFVFSLFCYSFVYWYLFIYSFSLSFSLSFFFLSFVYIFVCLCVLFVYWQFCDVSRSFYRLRALIVMTIGIYWKDVEENDLSPILNTPQKFPSRNWINLNKTSMRIVGAPPPRSFEQTVALGLKPTRSVVMESCVLFQQTRTSKRNSKIVRATRRLGKRLCTIYVRSWRGFTVDRLSLDIRVVVRRVDETVRNNDQRRFKSMATTAAAGDPQTTGPSLKRNICIYKKSSRLEFDAWTIEWTGTECKLKRNCTFLGYRKIGGNICTATFAPQKARRIKL